jgi:flagellar hook assembly protein FlgD
VPPVVIPNPFIPPARISYTVPAISRVSIVIDTQEGERVYTLVTGEKIKGEYSAIWDGRDAKGDAVPPGIYVCSIQMGKLHHLRTVLLLK